MGLFNAILGNASEANQQDVEKEFRPLLIDGEEIEGAFKVIRDMFVFTNKRLILAEKQLVGTKVDYLSITLYEYQKILKGKCGNYGYGCRIKNLVGTRRRTNQETIRKKRQ